MTRVSVTENHRQPDGNAGMTESHGYFSSVEVAQARAEGIAMMRGKDGGSLHWRQFSPTTWGLMSGQLYTYILVSLLPDLEPAVSLPVPRDATDAAQEQNR